MDGPSTPKMVVSPFSFVEARVAFGVLEEVSVMYKTRVQIWGPTLMLIFAPFGCTDVDDKGTSDDTSAPPIQTSDDTGGGSGSGGASDTWRPSGQGEAWLLDGDEDNSLFRLELDYALVPRDGEGYFGWLSGDGVESVDLGPIDVSDDFTVIFEYELGFNALRDGYDRFDAYAGPNQAAARTSGTHLWSGLIDPDLRAAYEELLIGSAGTVEEEGTLRSIQTTAERILVYVQETIGMERMTEVHQRAEAVSNAILGEEEDLDDDGEARTVLGTQPILGDEGLISMVLSGLDIASGSVEPGHPIKDLANWAYDCTQRIESYAETAYSRARISTVCASVSSCDDGMEDAEANLGWAMSGQDLDEDGSIEINEEGTIECAIFHVSRMAVMEVSTP